MGLHLYASNDMVLRY